MQNGPGLKALAHEGKIGVGVERVFPISSPFIDEIAVTKRGKVRRSRIYYLRNLTGKAARIREKRRPVSH